MSEVKVPIEQIDLGTRGVDPLLNGNGADIGFAGGQPSPRRVDVDLTLAEAPSSSLAARHHLRDLRHCLDGLENDLGRLASWAGQLAGVLLNGGRLLAVGNGGSAAQAQHLTAELVGRYRRERQAFSAIALHAESSTITALMNDYGGDEVFARQVRAHGRQGDVLLALSTSGASTNVLAAAESARQAGMITWALTGPTPNALAAATDDAVSVDGPTPTVQEIHQVAIHLLCEEVDRVVLG